jgi:hypothetical protein
MLVFLSSCAAPGTMGGQGAPRPTGQVVGSQTLTVYTQRSYQGEEVGTLQPGATVVIDQEAEDWSQVTFDNESGQQVTGWVPSNFLARSTAQSGGGKDLSGMKTRTTVEGTLTGAAVGAAAGALVAAMIGVNPAKGAALGAAIGTPLGLAAGVYVANQKEKYATEEQYLDACIAESRQYNEEARKDIAYMQNYIAEEEVRIADLRRQIARSASKKGLARAELQKMTAKKESMDKVLTSLEGEAGAQQKAISSTTRDPERLAALQKEVESTQESIVKFKRERDKLVSVMAKTKDLTL